MSKREFFSTVEEFVEFSGGDHAIRKILVANNGIGAIKAIRSIRRWSYETFGDERMVQFVVMATPEDLKANAEYIRMGDEVVDVPGGTNNNNYANVTLICEIAERHKVDAVMPMWGHASENPNLPTSLLKLKHRVSFIGPPAEPMYALGDKIGSTIIAQSATVPVIAWNGDNLRVDYKTTGIPASVYEEANVKTPEDALACCERIGYPVMIKASEGGGGKGIRKVRRTEEVLNAFRQVQGEIPGSPIFVMKMASNARHLEVQLLADKHGEAIALSGRDCSVQRRHQKIIEEGPPIAAPPNVFKRMEQAAVALAKTVGYCNAGTVEYLYLEATQEFAFLELNPRLQVEHPVTENILGINLPSCQLQVAMGIPLHRIADIRRIYGRHPWGRDTIDFDYSERQVPPRHCIAVRVTAENPEEGFQPTSGKIQELSFRSSPNVWGYFSVDNSGMIHEFADSQFGHIFAGGADRESARRAMIVALKELEIRGDIRTTIEYIIKMLQSDDFINNAFNTDWLDGRIARHKELAAVESLRFDPPPILVAACGAALQGHQHFEQRVDEFASMLRVGQIPAKATLSQVVSVDLIYNNIKYCTTVTRMGATSVLLECNGSTQYVVIRSLADGGYLLNIGGKSHLAYSRSETGGTCRMILNGHTCIFTPEYDPTVLPSTVAGKIARLLVSDGSHLNAGDPYVEIEVMKMYMPLRAMEAGTISFQMSEGAALKPGDVIANVNLDEPDKVVKAERFQGTLLSLSNEASSMEYNKQKPHLAMRRAKETIESVLEGFGVSNAHADVAIAVYINSFKNKSLPAYELEEALSVLRGRIDSDLFQTINSVNQAYLSSLSDASEKDLANLDFPSQVILSALHKHALSLPVDKRIAFNNQTSTIWCIAEVQLFSADVRILASLLKYLESYLAVEKLFDKLSFTDVVSDLRKDYSGNLEKLVGVCRSHLNTGNKNNLMMKIIDEMRNYSLSAVMQLRPKASAGIPIRNDINVRNLKLRLTDLSKLQRPACSQLSFAANLMLMEQYTISSDSRQQRLNDSIIAALTTGDPIGQGDRALHMKKFVDSNIVIQDLLLDALRQDAEYQVAAMEIYLRKIYHRTHKLINFSSGNSLSDGYTDSSSWVQFEFKTKLEPRGRHHSYDASEQDGARIQRGNSYATLSVLGEQGPYTYVHPVHHGQRVGVCAKIDTCKDLDWLFPLIVAKLPADVDSGSGGALTMNVIHTLIIESSCPDNSDDEDAARFSAYLASVTGILTKHHVSRVTFFVSKRSKKGDETAIFTFRNQSGFVEDRLFRHIEAPNAYHLDLQRLSNFAIAPAEGLQTANGNVHLYRAVPKTNMTTQRYFARLVSYTADVHNSELESLFVEAMDHMGIVIGREQASQKDKSKALAAGNHIFVNIVVPESVVELDFFEREVSRMCEKYWDKMVRLAVLTVELKVSCKLTSEDEPITARFVAANPTGFVLKVEKYVEEMNDSGRAVFKSVGEVKGEWNGLEVSTPYVVSHPFEQQRAEAMASSETLYVYDWPVLIAHAGERQWLDYFNIRSGGSPTRGGPKMYIPEYIFTCRELVVCNRWYEPLPANATAKDIEGGIVVPTTRPPGQNTCGMVAWLIFMKTPEYPDGREFVVISNDITYQAGSFGTKEDALFFKASEFARANGFPRLFLAANSGARIGMAQSLKNLFQICWADDTDPSKGFKYIYISKANYDKFLAKYPDGISQLPVICSLQTTAEGEERYVITDIIGEESDLGVENLMGSGLIAGETSRAYDDIFTLTLVVGRTVGIGAYLVRLGQRTIQKTRNSPIILTGYQALNKLMGREIYTTNDQLGGPGIMFPNGVSHLLADNHMDSVMKALKWMSYVPSSKGAPLPVLNISGIDSIERIVEFAPPKGLTYDPRQLLCGVNYSGYDDHMGWQSGFFDRNSFIEMLSGWAKTVIVGRARLGGIPIGVIVTENRTSEALKPADPADATSQEKMVQQAGGVWFPDSAYKTAQALKDFNREGLPCIIFANWRGFSGGQRDMFDEVLKFGSMIVDALVAYKQPLFVYIPPFAELRGGAWVVVDSTINSDVMEFYAAEDARGGVLEATGAASIKYRDRDIIATAHRLDHVLVSLDATLAELKASLNTPGISESDLAQINAKLAKVGKDTKARERMLFGVYQQVAVHFADLHDTPGRMKAKGVIKKQVEWKNSRKFFFWRLRRRIAEFEMAATIAKSDQWSGKAGTRKEIIAAFYAWFLENGGSAELWDDDRELLSWSEQNEAKIASFINGKQVENVRGTIQCAIEQLLALSDGDQDQTVSTIARILSDLPSDQRRLLEAAIQKE